MRKVYFFVPNLIDYVRLVLNLTAFYFILSKPFLTVTLHFTGGIVLDVLDGILARYLNQCSRYGALLDGLLDRCGRVGMMMSLCVFYPQHLFVLQLLVCLTIAVGVSVHYRRFLEANPVNPGDIYSVSQSYDHWLVKIYFEDPFLTVVLAGQDLCVAMLYLLHFSPGPSVSFAGSSYSLWVLLAWIGAPFFIYRQVVHGLLVFNSFRYLARLHDQENSKKVE